MNKEEFWKLFDEKKLKSITANIYGMFIQYTLNEKSGKYETTLGNAKLTLLPKNRDKIEIIDYVRKD